MVKRIIGTISLIIGVIGIAALLFALSNYDSEHLTTRDLVLPIIASSMLLVGIFFIILYIRETARKEKELTPITWECEECGTEISESDKTCPKCGVEFEEE